MLIKITISQKYLRFVLVFSLFPRWKSVFSLLESGFPLSDSLVARIFLYKHNECDVLNKETHMLRLRDN